MISMDAALDFWIAERSIENRDRLVASYAYLCARGARKFMRPGLERSDLEQVAAMGLLKACQRFDPSLKTPFEAYAWLFIVGELMHHVRDFERLVRPPRKLRTLERRFATVHDSLTTELGRLPSEAELAAAMGLCGAQIRELIECRARSVADSIDALPQTLPSFSRACESETLLDRLLIENALQSLSDTERAIIVGVYETGYSQCEIADRLGYSQRHISRLHKAALAKMLSTWSPSEAEEGHYLRCVPTRVENEQ